MITIITLRSITKPLSVAVDAANSIANGVVDINLDTSKKDEVGILLNAMNTMATNIKKMVAQLNETADAAILGKLDKRADAASFKGQYATIMTGFNKTLDAVIGPLNVTAEYVDRISKGDIPPKIVDEYKGDFNEIKNNLNVTIDVMNGIISESNNLINATKNGKLSTRANTSKYVGEWSKLLLGMNEIIDAFNKPFELTVRNITDLSNGILPEPISQRFGGDYDTVILNLNHLIEQLKIFIADMAEMEKQQEAGDIEFFMLPEKFKGFYKDMVIGVNAQVNSHLTVKKRIIEVVAQYGVGNFEDKMELLPGKKAFITTNVNKVRQQLLDITKEVDDMVNKAVQGDLSYRGNAEKFENSYKELISGVNKTLDAVVTPIKETKDVLEQWANGNLSIVVEGKYVGDHAALKDAIRKTAAQMPFKEAMHIFEKIAQGDLSQRMKGDFKGDALRLKNTLNQSLDSIEDILYNVAITVDEVTKGSLQVSDASTALSQGATEQAASLEEITSSMAEIASQTRTNAENANQANILSEDANKAADKGNHEMTSLNKAMNEISEASRNISRIMKVIDEIAFQTNLLALNAAVEAARAGRHGKGFAVVAEEVRNLAARSAAAAKETSEMIENTIKTVENGSMLAVRTGEVLEEIRNATIKVSDIVGEIASSSNEQAQGISQINEGLNQIDKVTQTNTASAEESASAAEELSSQANQLKGMINRFQLSSNRNLLSSGATFTSSTQAEDDFLINANSNYESMVLPVSAAGKSPEDEFFGNPEDIISLDEDDFGKY
jgi:methyl-accepting chemotaxis protein